MKLAGSAPTLGRSALPYALGAIALWSTSAATLVGLSSWSTFALLACTHLVGALVLNGWAVLRLGPRSAASSLIKVGWRALAYGLLGTLVYQTAFVAGLKTAPPTEANALNYLWPLCTAILAVPMRGERLSARLLLGLGFGLLGVAVLAGGPAEGDYPFRLLGYGAALAAAASWGLYSNLLAGLPLEPLSAQRAFLLVGATGFAGAALLTGTGPGTIDCPSIARLAYLGLGPVAGGVLLWQVAMRRGPVQRVATVSYLTPALSTLWLALFAGQPITPRLVLGLAAVLVAAALPTTGRSTNRTESDAS